VERYNEMCAKGEDEDYGKEMNRLAPVDTAPYYGIRTYRSSEKTEHLSKVSMRPVTAQADSSPTYTRTCLQVWHAEEP